MAMQLSFYGAVDTVTGSKYLLEAGRQRILVDCGLFQGFKQLRLRNWEPPPFDPETLRAVVLTHAHLDHSGYLPLLVRRGFGGPIFCTPATIELCRILLRDSAHLQEQDALFASRHGYSKHRPARPLYGIADAEACLAQFRPLAYGQELALAPGLSVRAQPAGHIIGSAILRLQYRGTTVVFSGDLGRLNSPVMPPPSVVSTADYLLVESTYGDRLHDPVDPEVVLEGILTETAGRGGSVLIPAFAVGRAQLVLFHLARLKAARRIPDLPVFLDSPMAIEAGEIFQRYSEEHRLSPAASRAMKEVARPVPTADGSKALDRAGLPSVIVSASGMATGGRVLHHLKVLAPDPRNTILFSGFQAGGTRGAAMVAGAASVKIHGQQVPVRARVENLHMLSAHADAQEILAWLSQFTEAPRLTFITHGEPGPADALRRRIEEGLGWSCRVPSYRDRFELR